MRRVLPSALLFTALAVGTAVQAQADRFAYAITDVSKDGANWSALRKLDLATGQYSDVILNGVDAKTLALDAVTKKPANVAADARWGTLMQTPFSTGVAAAAYDKKHNRIYFTPMFIDQLRYIDLKTMAVYYVTDQPLSGAGHMHNDEAKVVTRMVIAPDGNGYAINNNGTALVKFTTGKKPQITQLGTLVDDAANGGVSVHNRCSSFGGDMISDDKGNLFILSAMNHVFKVSIETKVATHLGHIEGLPARYTVNGAVVDGDGQLLVSSATESKAYYVVDPKAWTATAYTGAGGMYRTSDLANSNFLSSAAKNPVTEIATISRADEKFSNQISIYPNPVTNSRVRVQFNGVTAGDYLVELTDALGRSVLQRKLTVTTKSQVQELPLSEGSAKGMYMIKVYDAAKTSVFTQKVMVQ